MDLSDEHLEKAFLPIDATEEGISIDTSDMHS